MKGQLYELDITGLAYGGEAFGRLRASDGTERVVFVPFAIPGERVQVRITGEKRGFARADLVQPTQPSKARVTPRCKHFGACGGCHYQHMPYELQLRAKADILRDQFRRIAHIYDPPVRDSVPSPNPWNYRNHVQFHLTPEGRVGYIKAAHSRDEATGDSRQATGRIQPASILPISECYLPEPALNTLWPELEFDPQVVIDRVSLRQGVDEELMVVLESDTASLPELEMESGVSVVHTYAEHDVVLAGRDSITMQVLGRAFRVSAISFFQVNTAMAEEMVAHVQEMLRSIPNLERSTILDVYCGVGLFSAFVAPMCKRLVGIEASGPACDDFAANLDEFDNVELYEDAAENVLGVLEIRPDIVILDPPRAGLEAAAREGLLRLQPQSIIYVSCDPSTLARDARRLVDGGYRLESVTPFDLFPQTYHIESISRFELA